MNPASQPLDHHATLPIIGYNRCESTGVNGVYKVSQALKSLDGGKPYLQQHLNNRQPMNTLIQRCVNEVYFRHRSLAARQHRVLSVGIVFC